MAIEMISGMSETAKDPLAGTFEMTTATQEAAMQGCRMVIETVTTETLATEMTTETQLLTETIITGKTNARAVEARATVASLTVSQVGRLTLSVTGTAPSVSQAHHHAAGTRVVDRQVVIRRMLRATFPEAVEEGQDPVPSRQEREVTRGQHHRWSQAIRICRTEFRRWSRGCRRRSPPLART